MFALNQKQQSHSPLHPHANHTPKSTLQTHQNFQQLNPITMLLTPPEFDLYGYGKGQTDLAFCTGNFGKFW